MNQKDKTLKFKRTVDNTQKEDPQKEKIIKKLMEKFDITAEEAEKILIKLEQNQQNPSNDNNSKKQDGVKKPQNANSKPKAKESVQSKNTTANTNSGKNKKSNIKLQSRENVEVITPQHQLNKEGSEKIAEEVKDKKPVKKQPAANNTKPQKQPDKDKPKSKDKKGISRIMNKLSIKEPELPASDSITPQKQPTQDDTKVSEKPAQKPVDDTKVSEKPAQKPAENTEKVIGESKDKKPEEKPQNVDDILTGIIPDYQQQVSIELEHVDLTFNVETEKVETIKEKFINGVKRKKNKKLRIHALNDVSFKIYQGEKIGIIGYNGAGKSTLLKVVSGIYQPDSGKVNVNGMISPLLSLGAGFDRNYSGRKNIILNGAVLGYDKAFLESKMDEIIEFTELGEYIDLPIKNYSSGMLAKLGFAIATIVEPDILIIDEILSVGDITFKKKSRDKLRSLIDTGTTLLLVSHSIPQIRELCDKAIWIENGKVMEIGEVNKVCDNYIKNAEKASNEQLANIQFR